MQILVLIFLKFGYAMDKTVGIHILKVQFQSFMSFYLIQSTFEQRNLPDYLGRVWIS